MNDKLTPSYSESHALAMGIDKYKKVSPLLHATNDARGIADILTTRFGFKQENVRLLLDEGATRDAILQVYLSFAGHTITTNDRIIVFFAGHGQTVPSRRGEVGFLVPYDGAPTDLSSLIQWDQLTRNADLISAKHVLFLMDACYGGLAITRSPQAGSTRFLRDMLLRVSRQVLTAGKADEVVADLGGPLPEHSVFTGHLIEALRGNAADSQGLLTANGVMAYVYQRVAQDPDSHQTPHYGYLYGDGDMILNAPMLSELERADEKDTDAFYSIPAPAPTQDVDTEMTLIDRAKELLSDPKQRIKLHDLVATKTRECMAATADERFPLQTSWSSEEFERRLDLYERSTDDLTVLLALLGAYGTQEHADILTLAPRRLAGRIQLGGGLDVWLSLRWYPILLLAYVCGIASVASSKYLNLSALLQVPINDPTAGRDLPLVLSLVSGAEYLPKGFKDLPGHEKQYVPQSEYLFKKLQPELDDLLFLGTDYERNFDRFEMLLALEYAHLSERIGGGFWTIIGRFGWKHRRSYGSPYTALTAEATSAGAAWPPLAAGLFDGSAERFQEVSSGVSQQLNKLGWI